MIAFANPAQLQQWIRNHQNTKEKFTVKYFETLITVYVVSNEEFNPDMSNVFWGQGDRADVFFMSSSVPVDVRERIVKMEYHRLNHDQCHLHEKAVRIAFLGTSRAQHTLLLMTLRQFYTSLSGLYEAGEDREMQADLRATLKLLS